MNEPQRQFAEKELREWSDLISKSIEGSLDGVIRKFKIEGEFDAWVEGDHEEYKRYSFTLNFDGKRDGNRCTVKEIRVKLAEVIEIKGIQDERPN